jgi:hypothetical protein
MTGGGPRRLPQEQVPSGFKGNEREPSLSSTRHDPSLRAARGLIASTPPPAEKFSRVRPIPYPQVTYRHLARSASRDSDAPKKRSPHRAHARRRLVLCPAAAAEENEKKRKRILPLHDEKKDVHLSYPALPHVYFRPRRSTTMVDLDELSSHF